MGVQVQMEERETRQTVNLPGSLQRRSLDVFLRFPTWSATRSVIRGMIVCQVCRKSVGFRY